MLETQFPLHRGGAQPTGFWKDDVWCADIASQLNEIVKGRREPDLSSEELAGCTILKGPLLNFSPFD